MLQQSNVRTIHGKVTSICMDSKVAVYQDQSNSLAKDVSYDFLVVATGTRRSWPVVPRALERQGYIEDVEDHIKGVRESKRVVIVGGGGFNALFFEGVYKTN
jgi:NADH dehydrogenase FAD-containing subunit